MKTTWKKRAVQTSLLAIMTTIAFGAVSASAADTTSETQPTSKTVQMVKAVGAVPALHFRSSSVGLLNQPAHERNYLKMLATTYAPDTLADWKKALDDRKQAEADLPQPTFIETITISSKGLTKSDGTAPEQITRLLPVEDGVTSDIMIPKPVESESMIAKPVESESMILQQKLTKAVEAEDAEAIRAILPDLLKDFVKGTEDVREMSKKIKEQQAKEAEKK
ncbi:hypothetical protein [Paenibacillus qinlingensis]|uniref:hypothetical protein n=1 Tax=Paenibacillus qinlingensis TaxID=1837343 RepID=UPI0015643C23|nr:hypothetical protein [Paenibacillus qinlingensis]NQX61363.1 hypothetical protein [Paenibacillus qinlingensis]